MNYSINNISDYIINYANETHRNVTNLKLQKILYFLYGFYYSETGNLLFDEDFEAWEDGPVVRKSFEKYSAYKDKFIPPNNEYFNLFSEDSCQGAMGFISNDYRNAISISTSIRIDELLNTLLSVPVEELVDFSRSENGPWYKTFEKGKVNLILKEDICKYFRYLK